ncbi:MAG: GNAT family N-acetyltransferase [Fibrobacterota bacterium]|nr:GNAT family N-acetyltransferase [Fibrobacterota bacterium]
MELKFIQAIESDFEDLLAIRIEAMRESLQRLGRFDLVRARERFANGFSPFFTRIIFRNEQRVGFVVVQPNGNHLLLDHLYIHPTFQRQGIGSSVLKVIFEKAERTNMGIRVGALKESESNKFYIRNGFKLLETGEWDLYYFRESSI